MISINGFAFGDTIVSIDSYRIETIADVELVMKNYKVGDKITVKVKRSGVTVDVEVILEEKVPDTVDFN